MDDLWRIYAGFMEDLCRIYKGFMEDLWRIYGRFMEDLWTFLSVSLKVERVFLFYIGAAQPRVPTTMQNVDHVIR